VSGFAWWERCEPLRQAQADPRLTPMERRVFTVLWTFAGPDGGDARPGRDLLAACLSTESHPTHVRSVRNAVARLEGLGYIVLTAKAIRRRRIANTYRVQVPPLPDGTEFLGREALRPNDDGFRAQSGEFYGAIPDVLGREASRHLKGETEGKTGGARARATPPPPQEPPRKCSRHRNDPNPPHCPGCRAARLAAFAYDRAVQARNRERDEAIRRCRICDDRGYVGLAAGPFITCPHDPQRVEELERHHREAAS
jgi:hypothetical protein